MCDIRTDRQTDEGTDGQPARLIDGTGSARTNCPGILKYRQMYTPGRVGSLRIHSVNLVTHTISNVCYSIIIPDVTKKFLPHPRSEGALFSV